jgi:hypothetical protein
MANPLPEEKELYGLIQSQGLSIDKVAWDFFYHRVNDSLVAIILICQRWLEHREAMPVEEAERIVVWIKDIKNIISAVTSPSKESLSFPQFQGMNPISPIIQELITHQFGNDIYDMELILQNAIDPIDPGPIIADVYQALVSNRPYRKAYSKEKAVTIIRKASGTHFDPAIVNAFSMVLQREQ